MLMESFLLSAPLTCDGDGGGVGSCREMRVLQIPLKTWRRAHLVLSVLIEVGHWSEIPGVPAGLDCP